jgi:Zn-dependent protease
MKGGFKIFRVLGIDVLVDYSWFIIFFLVTWSLVGGYFPMSYPGLPPASHWLMGLTSSLLLFGSVLLHELCHSYVANRFGQGIHRIRLFIFGGVAELTHEPDDPVVEFDIAIAGPICSLTLHFIFSFLAYAAGPAPAFMVYKGIFLFLSYVNGALALFNLIPGFPLDGGRILRSILWKRTGNIKKATRTASSIGRYFALFLIIMGFFQVFKGDLVGGLWYVFIGMFLQHAAAMSYENVVMKDVLGKVLVRDVMVKDLVVIPGETAIDRVVEDYYFKYRFDSFPVSAGGVTDKVITLEGIKRVPKEQWQSLTAADCAQAVPRDLTIRPTDMVLYALQRMAEREFTQFFIVEDGVIVGVISRHDVTKLLKVKVDLG